MKTLVLSLAVIVCGAMLFAQTTKDPVTSVVKQILPRQQKNLIAAAEEMPADKYSYKPTPDQGSFAHLMMHIAESNNSMCSKIADLPEPKANLKETDGKDKLVAAIKASFEVCTSALAKADDSKLGDSIEGFNGQKVPRAFAFIVLTSGWADHYGAAAMYLRLNGLLPPTAQPKK